MQGVAEPNVEVTMLPLKPATAPAGPFGLARSKRYHMNTRQLGPLLSWNATAVSTSSPPGRPDSTNTAYISVMINSGPLAAGPQGNGTLFLAATTGGCSAAWEPQSELPYGRTYGCVTGASTPSRRSTSAATTVYSWIFKILLEGGDGPQLPTKNFIATFTFMANMTTPDGDKYRKVLAGTQHFTVGENLEGVCGASGACS
ncbi:hypothetical protein GGS23DRAFT_197711 [Durotheca rogersii]|uniref:uncharacterized protein n=1 Tax=Durotheca rogersii TaxID=419775 RepID=UPI002220219F|nr:uncharacterized protein GGS23DRAFT_197711 [Durotheca rogersii]KAI5867816.1 hypothetical protein GGS23DRAFT_197711 [Durotheca rogersii]